MKRRLRALGLRQRTIAALLGASEQWVSLAIRRPVPPVRVVTVIVAWELMTPSQRGELLFRTGLGRMIWPARQRLVGLGEDDAGAWPWMGQLRPGAASGSRFSGPAEGEI
jgi:hypothetical protein